MTHRKTSTEFTSIQGYVINEEAIKFRAASKLSGITINELLEDMIRKFNKEFYTSTQTK